jgi:hypothetical protein
MKKARSRQQEPSKASLREMPEVDWTKAKPRPNPYSRRIVAEGLLIHVSRGRPKKGTETGPTIPRSVRFPATVWAQIERRAAKEGLPLHAALRAAVLGWLKGKRAARTTSIGRGAGH